MTSNDRIVEVDPREARLPAWAQDILNDQRSKIRYLESELRTARTDLRTARGQLDPSGQSVIRYETDSGALPLPGRGTVAFQVGKFTVDATLEGDGVRVEVLGGKVTVRPLDRAMIDVVPVVDRRR